MVVLPAPFGPEEAEDLALLDLERQPVEGASRAAAPEADRVVLGELMGGFDRGVMQGPIGSITDYARPASQLVLDRQHRR